MDSRELFEALRNVERRTNTRFTNLEARFDNLESRIHDLEAKLDTLIDIMSRPRMTHRRRRDTERSNPSSPPPPPPTATGGNKNVNEKKQFDYTSRGGE